MEGNEANKVFAGGKKPQWFYKPKHTHTIEYGIKINDAKHSAHTYRGAHQTLLLCCGTKRTPFVFALHSWVRSSRVPDLKSVLFVKRKTKKKKNTEREILVHTRHKHMHINLAQQLQHSNKYRDRDSFPSALFAFKLKITYEEEKIACDSLTHNKTKNSISLQVIRELQ